MTETQVGPEQQVVGALESLIKEARKSGQLITPRGYPHLGLAILDSMFSLRARYDTVVVPILQRYCEANGAITWDQCFDESVPEFGAQALLDHLGPMSSDERCSILSRHVAPGTSKRKADVCVEIASVLVEKGVDSHTSLARVLTASPGLEWDVRQIKGVGPAAWRYLLNLSRVEKVKPDVMIVRWVSDAAGSHVSQKEAARLVESAALDIQGRGDDISVRTVDHLIWRKESGRPLTDVDGK